jgi:hypothetical protein
MKNRYIFDEAPVKICASVTERTDSGLKTFLTKYPELTDRIEVENRELLFLISLKRNISERNWTVDFLESNINKGRNTNGEGKAFSAELYADLFDLFNEDGVVYFDSGNDFCAMETTGAFDCRYHFRINREGVSWEEDD